jgi:type VI secretion system lysozyme-like protein
LDRLFDFEPRQTEEAQPQRVLRRAQVVDSIRTELVRLLNTRCAETIDRLPGQDRTVVNYGLPDFLTLKPRNDRDRQRLASLVGDAIRAYEPRLRNPSVTATTLPGTQSALLLAVEGTVVLGELSEPVSFPLMITERGTTVAVAADAGGPALA